jgi:hypothetical protein
LVAVECVYSIDINECQSPLLIMHRNGKGVFRNETTEYGRKLRIDRASRAALGDNGNREIKGIKRVMNGSKRKARMLKK